jgi:hypothetical protein
MITMLPHQQIYFQSCVVAQIDDWLLPALRAVGSGRDAADWPRSGYVVRVHLIKKSHL